ncbi:MAG: hypothetical protein K2X32_01505 [Phycisphaerales bacterium]|nr:hypothetical protein [Phycisphaerales bacterium]
MGTAAKLLARVCESTGSFNAGLLCNGLWGAAMAAIERGGIGAGLATTIVRVSVKTMG